MVMVNNVCEIGHCLVAFIDGSCKSAVGGGDGGVDGVNGILPAITVNMDWEKQKGEGMI